MSSEALQPQKTLSENQRQLYQCVYVSHIRYLALFDYRIFEKLAFSALSNNLKRNITGVLCFGNGYFMQYIEGSEQDLTNLKNNLLKDNRHHSFKLCDFSPIEERMFPNHPRGFVVIDEKHQVSDSTLHEFIPFNPKLLHIDSQLNLIRYIKESDLMNDEFKLSLWDLNYLRVRLLFQLFSDSVSKGQLSFIFRFWAFQTVFVILIVVAIWG